MELTLLIALISLALGLVGGYYLHARLPARRWLARHRLFWRSADEVADDAGEVVEEAPAPLELDAQLPPKLRLEVAAPERPLVGRPFDLVVGLIDVDDRRPLPEIVRAAEETAEPPPNALRFRVGLEGANAATRGFTTHGPAEQTAVWWPGGPPALLVFRLAADDEAVERPTARLVVYQGLREAGRTRLQLEAVRPGSSAATGGGAASGWAVQRSVVTVRAPQAAEHLLAHAFAETHAPEELAALADELGAPEPAAGASRFTTALDLVTHAARNGETDELAARLVATRPDWRAALRENRRAQRLVN